MRKLIYSMLLIVAGALTACDDYIDITPKGAITVDSTQTYYELVVMPNRTYWPSSYALIADDAYTVESNVIGKETTTLDAINFTFNETADRTQLGQNNLYENCYSYILRYNLVISNIDNSTGDASLKLLAKSEAKLLRAWEHFVVLNTYAKAYDPATAAQEPAIALMREYDLEATPTKSTVEEAYQFIMQDIEDALPNLQTEPTTGHPSLAYGYALKALVKLFHHDWVEAGEAAQKSLDLNSQLVDYTTLTKVTSNTPYRYSASTDGNPEVLDITTCSTTFTSTLTYGYGQISPELTNLFDQTNDQRYKLFFKQSGNAYYYDAGSGASLWQASATLKRFYYSTVGLRTAEMYLILAESYARQGKLSEAMSLVNTLRKNRILNYEDETAPGSTKEMMNVIILERRKELLFGFHRFWDLKRLNTETDYQKTLTRVFPVVNTSVAQQTYTLKPGSSLYVIPFPTSATEKNPNLTPNY